MSASVKNNQKLPVDTNGGGTDFYSPIVLSAQDYYPFGMLMPGRSFNSGSYRYGHGTQEMVNEISGIGNHYTAEFWEYDSRLVRRWNIDPVVKTWESGYVSFRGNPIWFIDPLGDDPSKHTDEEGNIVAEYDDDDDGVYVHKNGTTKSDIDQQRLNNNNTGGTGTHIGDIGGNINISGIMERKLGTSINEAKEMDIIDYFKAVKPEGKWDLKSNMNTIFGVAWTNDRTEGTNTTFSFENNKNMSAADVGNYHAGFTGRHTYNSEGMSYGSLWYGAGAAESFKSLLEIRFVDLAIQLNQMMGPRPPFGDRPKDFIWNTKGMIDADAKK